MSERKNVRAVQRREAQRRRERKTASVAAAAAVQHCFGEGREGRKEGGEDGEGAPYCVSEC